MTRRLVHALAALIAAALVVVVPGTPAHADPQPQSTALCSVEEWKQPKNFADCTRRLANAGAQRVQCIQAPTPSSPDAGIAGWFTSRPDADMRSGVVGLYSRYGVGGYRLEMYDVGCAGAVTNAGSSFQNDIAGVEFALAAGVLGAANGLRDHAYDPSAMWSWSDTYVEDLTRNAYDHLFVTFGVLAVAAAALYLLWKAPQGRLSHAARTAGWAVLVMVLATAVAHWPLATAHGFDKAGGAGLAAVHNVLGPGPENISPDQCRSYQLDPEACNDHRTIAVRTSDAATEAILYKAWLRAELGSADSPTAQKYGPALYDATTFTWADAEQMRSVPSMRQTIIGLKAQQWLTIAEQIKAEDPEAYANLQGLRGTDRIGSGLIAVLSAVAFASFDVIASFMILLGFLLVRIAVVFLPVVATWGVLEPASNALRKLIDRTIGALFNIIRYGAMSGLYLWAVVTIFKSPLSGGFQILAVLLAAVACWLIIRPTKRFRPHLFPQVERETGGGPSWRDRLFTAAGAAAGMAAATRSVRDEPIRAEASAGRPRRPEARALGRGR
jgi:hypothetical protein